MDTDFETSSIDEAEAMEIDKAPSPRDWRTQYLDWMIRGVLPSNRAQARRLATRTKSFVLIDNELYKRSPSGVLQRCIPIPEGKELIRDIHAGVCSHHAVPLPSDRAQARRIARQAESFVLIDDKLYKRSPSGVLQCCIPTLEGKKLI